MKATLQGTMKAVRMHQYGGPEVLVYEDAPRPEPGEHEVLIRVMAAGVNPVDWKVRDGLMKELGLQHHLPLIPGWEASGVVEEIGAKVAGVKIGAPVFANFDTAKDGAYAEFAVTDSDWTAPKPDNINWIDAAAVPLAGLTAWQALFDVAELSSFQTVLIHGAAGGVGIFAVQLAKWRGANVIATASDYNHDFLRDLGADEVLDYHGVHFADVLQNIDVVLDTVGGETQDRSWGVIKEGGWLVSIVQPPSPQWADKYGVRGQFMRMLPKPGQLEELGRLIERDEIKPFVSQTFSLADARRAQGVSESRHVRGKIVLKVA